MITIFNANAFAKDPSSICPSIINLLTTARPDINEDQWGTNVTFPVGIKAPLQFNFPVPIPAPEIIRKNVQKKFDELDAEFARSKMDRVSKAWLKHRARMLVLELDLTDKFSFFMLTDGSAPNNKVWLRTQQSGNYIVDYNTTVFTTPLFHAPQYLRGFDGHTYIQVKLEGDAGRNDQNKTFSTAYATIQARVDTKTGEYTDIRVISSSVITRDMKPSLSF